MKNNLIFQENNMMLKTTMSLVIGLIVGLVPAAIAQDRPARGYPGPHNAGQVSDAPAALKKEVLKASYFDSSSTGTFPFCTSMNCTAIANLYTESLMCPGVAGKTCTYEVVIDAQVYSSGFSKFSGEEGIFQFQIDGAIPSGGGTSGNGDFFWQNAGPSFFQTASHSVHHTVTNAVTNQSHSVVVNFGCIDNLFDPQGCYAESGYATLTVRVLTP